MHLTMSSGPGGIHCGSLFLYLSYQMYFITVLLNNVTKGLAARNQGIFRIEKKIVINRELTMTLMRLITIKCFNRLRALIKTKHLLY